MLLLAASYANALTPSSSTNMRLEIAPYSQVNELYIVGTKAGRSLLSPRRKDDRSQVPSIAKFQAIYDRHLTRVMAFKDTPKQRNESALDLRRLFWWHAARSATRQQFADATFPLLPEDQHGELFAAFAAATASHLILAKSNADLKTYRTALSREIARSVPLIAKMRRFYGSVWPVSKPFHIHLLPKTKPSSTTMATIVADRILLEVPAKPSPDRAKQDMTVILHELAHGLYGSQPLSLKSQLDRLFTNEPSLASNGAYKLIDEAMATAIGNAMGYKLLLGRLPPEPWYLNRGIDGLAHAILPLVEGYLDGGKTIDARFVGDAIKLYQNMMGEELYQLDVLLKDVVLAVSGELSMAESKNRLKQAFPSIAGFYQSRPLTAPETRETIETAVADLVPIIVIYKTPAELRSAVDGILPKPLLADLLASPSQVWSVVAAGDKAFIGMQVKSEADIPELLSRIKKVAILPQTLHRYR